MVQCVMVWCGKVNVVWWVGVMWYDVMKYGAVRCGMVWWVGVV